MKEFLLANSGFVEALPVDSYLNALSEPNVFAALHAVGLLSEAQRKRFVAEVQELAIDTPDAYFLSSERLRNIFTTEELGHIIAKIKSELIPNLNDVTNDWRHDYQRTNGSPEGHFYSLKSNARKEFTV